MGSADRSSLMSGSDAGAIEEPAIGAHAGASMSARPI
jgi:hypothetical protein